MATVNEMILAMRSTLDSKGFDEMKAKLKELDPMFEGMEQDATKAGQAAEDAGAKGAKGMDGLGKSGALAALKLGGLLVAFKKIFDVTKDVSQSLAQQQQLLKSTGEAAGLSTVDLERMRKAMRGATTFDEAEITKAQNYLLTFTAITKDQFEDVLKIGGDMAALFGGGLKENMIRVGKAAQAPGEQIAALRDIGASFDAKTTQLVKTLDAAGKKSEAWGIILKELRTEFGGAAQAMLDDSAGIGTIEQVMTKVKDVFADIGKLVFPMIADILKFVGGVVQWMRDAGQGGKALVAIIAAIGLAVSVNPILGIVAGVVALAGALRPATASVREINDAVRAVNEGYRQQAESAKALDEVKNQTKGLKEGSKEYEKQMGLLIAQNKLLQDANVKTGDSYEVVEAKLKRANSELTVENLKRASEAYDKGTNTIERYAMEIEELEAKRATAAKNGQMLSLEDEKRLEALRNSYNKTLEATIAAAEATGKSGKEILDRLSRVAAIANDYIIDTAGFARQELEKLRKEMNAINLAANTISSRAAAAVGKSGKPKEAATGAATGGAKGPTLDEEKERQRLILEGEKGLAKELLKITYDFENKRKEIRRAVNINRTKSDELIEKNRLLASKKTEDAIGKFQFDTADKALGYFKDAAKALEGDFSGLLGRIAKDAKAPWLGWVNAGIGIIQGFFGLFTKQAETATKSLLDDLEEVFDAIRSAETGADLWERVLGGATKESLQAGLTGLESGLDSLFTDLGAKLSREQINALLEGLSSGQLRGDVEKIRAAQEKLRKAAIIKESFGIDIGIEEITAEANVALDAFFDKYGVRWETLGADLQDGNAETTDYFLKSLQNISEVIDKIDDKKIQAALIQNKQRLEEIKHKIAIGELDANDLDVINEQIAIYDSMIASLQGMEQAEGLIRDLEVDRYALQQQINEGKAEELGLTKELLGISGKYLQDQTVKKLLADYEKLQRDIQTGKVRAGSAEAVQMEQSILTRLDQRLGVLGADDIARLGVQTALATSTKGYVGERGYAALSGQGYVPTASFPSQFPGVASMTTSYDQRSNVNFGGINIDSSSPGYDIFNQMINYIQGAYGVNLLRR